MGPHASKESLPESLSPLVPHRVLPCAPSHSPSPTHPAPVESKSEIGDAATWTSSAGSTESSKTTHTEPCPTHSWMFLSIANAITATVLGTPNASRVSTHPGSRESIRPHPRESPSPRSRESTPPSSRESSPPSSLDVQVLAKQRTCWSCCGIVLNARVGTILAQMFDVRRAT